VWRRALFLLCGVGMLSIVSPLRTQEVGAEASAKAHALFESGLTHQRLGETAEACSFFESSVALEGTTDSWLEAGKCREARDPLGAIRSFEAVLAGARQMADARRRAAYEKTARQHLERLSPRVSRLTFQPSPTPGVSVDIAPVGEARGEPVTVYGDPVRFNPGRYRVRAWAPGSFSYLLEVELRAGEERELALPSLQPLPIGATGAAGARSAAAARSAVPPGRSTTPPSTGRSAPPAHLPPRSAPVSDRPRSAKLAAPPAATAPALPDHRASSGIGVLPVTLFSGGVALVIAGVVTGQLSSAERNDLRRDCVNPDPVSRRRSCPSDSAGTKRRMENYAIAADVLWVTGTILAGTGVTLFLVRREREPEARVSLGCFAGGCGLSGSGSF
jgi:hypothetical protein